jgi:hypothetical protein
MKPIKLPPPQEYRVLITFEGRCYLAKSLYDWKRQYQYDEKDGSIREEAQA